MPMTNIEKAYACACHAHFTQKRKYTGEPYVNHVRAVADLVAANGGDENQVIAALLHDTVEDTQLTLEDLRIVFGDDVTKLVEELTNVYEKAAYPTLNRAERKKLEGQRLGKISARAQTIKYCDFLDNGGDIIEQNFAKTYFREIAYDVGLMTAGDPYLRKQVIQMILDYVALSNDPLDKLELDTNQEM
jgi:hypothetical protein